MMRKKALLLPIGLLAFAAFGQDFSSAPVVTQTGNGYTVAFTITAASDVEVAVLNGRDSVVRHLAAGVLGGGFAPPAPLVSGLSQSLQWDGADDNGAPVADGVFKVRVRLGLTPAWNGKISTMGIPGSHCATPYTPLRTEPYIRAAHPIFNRIALDHKIPNLYVEVDRNTDEVWIRLLNGSSLDQYRYNGLTGDSLGVVRVLGLHLWQYWGEIVLTNDAKYFYFIAPSPDTNVWKYSRDGRPALFGPGKAFVAGLHQSNCTDRGQAVDRNGSLYVLHPPFVSPIANEYGPEQYGVLTRIDSLGNITDTALVTIPSYVSGVKIDRQGNIFVGARVKPYGEYIPRGLDSLLPADTAPRSLRWWADEMYGSILKFRPTGGTLLPDDTGSLMAGRDLPQATPPVRELDLTGQGLEWMFYGVTAITTHYGQRNSDETYFIDRGSPCECEYNRFDVDGYGRVFVLDPFTQVLNVLDNNKNLVLRFAYRDYPAGATPLGWAHQVEVTDKGMYMADHLNNQVARFLLSAQKESATQVLIAVENGRPRGSLRFGLLGLSPNPCNGSAVIRAFAASSVPGAGERPRLAVHDMSGKKVRELSLAKLNAEGTFSAAWDGRDGPGRPVAAGVYIVRLSAGRMADQRNLVLVR